MRTSNELTVATGAYYKGRSGTSCEGRLIYVLSRSDVHELVDVRVKTLRGRRGIGSERWLREESILHNYSRVQMLTARQAAERLGVGARDIELRVTRGLLTGVRHNQEIMVDAEALEEHCTSPTPSVGPGPISNDVPASQAAATPTRAELREWMARVMEVNDKLERLLERLTEADDSGHHPHFVYHDNPQNGIGGLWQ